jgi:hypothetical protein
MPDNQLFGDAGAGCTQRYDLEDGTILLPCYFRPPISVAFSILIAFIVIGIFLFRIRERFDTVDVQALDRFRGERR